MSFFVLPPSASTPLPLPPEGHEPVAPGGVFLVPASTWRFEEDIEPLLTAIRAAPWAPLVIVEDAAEMPRCLGTEAPWVFAQAADIVRVAPPALIGMSVSNTTPLQGPRRREGHHAALSPRPHSDVTSVSVEVMVVAVWGAVRARPVPDAQAMGRLLRHAFEATITESVIVLLKQRVVGAGLSRRFAKACLPPPRSWLAAARAVRAVACSLSRNVNQETAAYSEGHTGVSLSAACRGSFGLDWKALRQFGAWEGLVELFLRKRGATLAKSGNNDRLTLAG